LYGTLIRHRRRCRWVLLDHPFSRDSGTLDAGHAWRTVSL